MTTLRDHTVYFNGTRKPWIVAATSQQDARRIVRRWTTDHVIKVERGKKVKPVRLIERDEKEVS